MKKISLLVTLLLCYLVTPLLVKAVDCEDVSKYVGYGLDELISCKDQLEKRAQALDDANKTNTRDLTNLRSQIAKMKTQISGLEAQLAKLTKEVFDREVKVGIKEELLTAKVRRDYIQKRSQSLLLILFSARSANEFFQDLAYREKLARSDREIISSVSGEIAVLSAQKKVLSTQKINLDALKKRVDEQAGFLAKEVDKANKYVSDLSGKVAALSARQQSLLAEKTGTYATSVGDVPLADDPASRPDYNPGFSPAFAAFSFGAPHFKGMSQYGAFGRAKSGQNADTILHAYYGGLEIKKDYPSNINITVQGYGTVDLETYVKRIYEMPGSWGDEGGFEALKAQAVAARSYALA